MSILIKRRAKLPGPGFVNVYRPRVDGSKYSCPCCYFRTLDERGGYDICPICFWEDDGQDDHDASEVRGGSNASLSLTEGRANFERIGACEEKMLPNVRPPLEEEKPRCFPA
ncbi:CPCC family cysteine-rich protein [Terriglobus saanensis]|uniref:Cysteine-rich CPCC domain-containing protein n=1 Tax=Terriglobus saanensis (strain ATCC BAA-1853 / DSM 23119 / SP1PR4) TaxID=401053 RepID=E8V8N1_TERSS|nr:hypothetical protein AciPR4_3314 [Terriglobus saanensis SP1PR4]